MPAGLHVRRVLREIDAEVELHLLCSALAKEDRVHESTGDGRTLLREWDGDARGLPNGFCLAKNYFEHRAVDGAVRGIEQHGADDFCRLPKAVYAAFPLLMAGWVP